MRILKVNSKKVGMRREKPRAFSEISPYPLLNRCLFKKSRRRRPRTPSRRPAIAPSLQAISITRGAMAVRYSVMAVQERSERGGDGSFWDCQSAHRTAAAGHLPLRHAPSDAHLDGPHEGYGYNEYVYKL